tara:strand:+ start:169 stop:1173 length:1005 start_codon:yes stop_codon:yes gene_type:complete
MALQILPWLIRAGQGLAAATGTRGAAKGAAKILKKRPKWDYDKVEGWQRPLWQRPTPVKGGVSRGPGGRFVGGARNQPGWINRMYMNPTTGVGSVARLAGLTAGGSIAADRIASMMRDDEVAPDASAIGGGRISPSMPTPTKLDFESRQAFETRKSKKMNKQMKRLLQYYGIVNLINPDSASDMLKLGTAMLEQEIGQMGTDRQAKIFDAIFKDGSMPASGAEAARMILNAGGTAEDVADITDIYESITPKAPDLAEDERGVLDLQQARSLVSAGYDNEAVNLIEDSIRSGRLENEQKAGMQMNPREQAQIMVQAMGGAASGGLDSSLLNIEPE